MNPHRYHYEKFTKAHLASVELLEEKNLVVRDAEFLESLGGDPSKDAFFVLSYWDKIPFSLGGWYRVAPTIIKFFAIPTTEIFKIPLTFTKCGLFWIKHIEQLPSCNKIVTFSLADERIDRWMKTLGLGYERTLLNYTEGRDYKVWSKEKVNGLWRHTEVGR